MEVQQTLKLESCEIDLLRRLVLREGASTSLSDTENRLLAYLTSRPGQPIRSDELLSRVWGYRGTARTKTLKTTINRLRKKIEAVPSKPTHLCTVHRLGYRFELPVQTETGQAKRSNLTADVTSFIGREQELEKLDSILENSRLVTLLGPPGAGKTRTSRRLGERWLDKQGQQVWFCDLTEAVDLRGVLAAMAATIGLSLIREKTVEEGQKIH